jgi:hypothetical protein
MEASYWLGMLEYRLGQGIFGSTREQINAPRLGVEVARCRTRRFNDFHEQMLRHRIGLNARTDLRERITASRTSAAVPVPDFILFVLCIETAAD